MTFCSLPFFATVWLLVLRAKITPLLLSFVSTNSLFLAVSTKRYFCGQPLLPLAARSGWTTFLGNGDCGDRRLVVYCKTFENKRFVSPTSSHDVVVVVDWSAACWVEQTSSAVCIPSAPALNSEDLVSSCLGCGVAVANDGRPNCRVD